MSTEKSFRADLGISTPSVELTQAQFQSPFVSTPINFIKTPYGDEVDYIDTDVAITRGNNQGIYNPDVEGGWNQNVSPQNTLWNSDGWGDLSNVTSRAYVTFYQASGNGSLGYNVVGTEYVMYDTVNDKYYAIKFSNWAWNGEGGSIQYTRALINTTVYFTKTNYGSEVDNIGTDVAITRGNNGGIYNPLVEGGWNQNISPENTLWNGDGWKNFENFTDRVYAPFYTALNGELGNHVIGAELIMYDTVNEQYYAVMFTQWTQGNNGGGFSYSRRLLNNVPNGIAFADGTIQRTAAVAGPMPVRYNFLNEQDDNDPNLPGQATFTNNDTLKLSTKALNGVNQYSYYDYLYANYKQAVVRVTNTENPDIWTAYQMTNIEPYTGNIGYRGFTAGVNRIYGSGDPNINQLIITKDWSLPAYGTDGDTNSDDFTATNVNTDFIAMVNIYGSNTNDPMPIDNILVFFQSFVDNVIYAGGGSIANISTMQSHFYSQNSVLQATVSSPGLYSNFEFFNSTRSYSNPAYTGGTGSGFNVTVQCELNGTYSIVIISNGVDYVVGDVITIDGAQLGGNSGTNDIVLTVDSVDGSGAIITFTFAGTPLYTYEWPSNYISDGGHDQYDGGNYLNTNLGTNIQYAGGVIQNSDVAFGGGSSSYFVGFKGSIFAMIGTNVSGVNKVYYTGDLGADGGGYEKPRSLYEPSYYNLTTVTLNTNGNVNYQWNTQWYVEVDITGQNLGNIYINPNNNTIGTTSNGLYLSPARTNNLYIDTNDGTNTYEWQFRSNGNLTFPDSTVQSTAYTGVAEPGFTLQAGNFTAEAGGRYGVDTWSADGPVTATLPESPNNGDAIFFADAGSYAQNGALTIDAGTNTIMDNGNTLTVTTSNQSVGLFWNGRTWRTYNAG